MEHNRELAARFAREVRALPQACWRNAALAVMGYRDSGQAAYIEGIIVIMDGMFHAEHAWMLIDGQIVDPTLDDIAADCYYPLFIYSEEELWQQAEQRLTLPYYMHDRERRHQMWRFSWEIYQEYFSNRPGEKENGSEVDGSQDASI